MTAPPITVLMPVYNGETYLREAIESVLDQTFPDFEFIIFDDGSTDGSLEIIRDYDDKRINLIQNRRNVGIAGNLNRGISLARGKYILRMDADDICLPGRFEEQFKFMETNRDVAVCGAWVEFIGKKIKWLTGNILKDPTHPEEIRCYFLFNCVLKHPTVIIRKEVFQQEGYLYDEKVNRAEDYDLWVRVSKKYDLANLSKVLLKYRVHQTNISAVHKKENVNQSNEIRKNLLMELGIKPTKKDLRLHLDFAKRARKEYPDEILDGFKKWLLKIYRTNNKSKVYDEETLQKVLSQKWRDKCGNESEPNWETACRA